MAQVKINIPGIGEVTAENVASEDTLLKLLAAMNASKKSGLGGDKAASDSLLKSKKDETKAIDDSTKAVSGSTKAQDTQRKATDATSKAANDFADSLITNTKDIGAALLGGVASISKSAVSLAAQFATSYQAMADNPIGAAAGTLNTFIDAGATAIKVGGDVFGSAVKAAGSALGPWSGVVTHSMDAVLTAGKATVDLLASVAKIANDVMAAEFNKSAKALQNYTAKGASFAGGLGELRGLAAQAGVDFDIMNKAALNSSESFRNSGLTQGEGVALMAKSMSATANTIQKGGRSVRDEMLSMGFSYQEQGEVAALFMAQLKAGGRDIKNLAPEELARGTKEYATNLKVISDITGEDAKKLQEKARAETQRAALTNRLDKDQKEAFSSAYSLLSKYGPEVQNALIQQIAGGTITDTKIAANQDLVRMIQEVAGSVQAADKDITASTTKYMGEARERLANSDFASQIDFNALMAPGTNALVDAISTINNRILSANLSPDQAEKSRSAAEQQAESIDKQTKNFVALTDMTNKQAVLMQQKANDNMETYTDFLNKTMDASLKTFQEGLDAMGGKLQAAMDKLKEIEQKGVSQTIKDTTSNALRDAQANPENSWITRSLASSVRWFTHTGEQWEPIMNSLSGLIGSPGKADGGMSSGPESGYLEKLHGDEAVIPTVGGRVPLDIDLSGLMKEFSGESIAASIAEVTAKILAQAQSEAASGSRTSQSSGEISASDMALMLRAQSQHMTDSLDIQSKLVSLMETFIDQQQDATRLMEESAGTLGKLLDATA